MDSHCRQRLLQRQESCSEDPQRGDKTQGDEILRGYPWCPELQAPVSMSRNNAPVLLSFPMTTANSSTDSLAGICLTRSIAQETHLRCHHQHRYWSWSLRSCRREHWKKKRRKRQRWHQVAKHLGSPSTRPEDSKPKKYLMWPPNAFCVRSLNIHFCTTCRGLLSLRRKIISYFWKE